MGLDKTLTCEVALTFRQQNVVRPFEHLFADCNLYIVTRRPRTHVVPGSVRINRKGRLSGKFVIETDTSRKPRRHRFAFPLTLPINGRLSWARDLPRDYYQILDQTGNVVFHGDPWGLLLLSTGFASALAAHEVIYVGHSVGTKRERNSLDRIAQHEKIQKIYSDHFGDNYDFFINLVRFDGSSSMFQLSTPADFNMSQPHVAELTARSFTASRTIYAESIKLAEAALIAYFKPAYNEHHKHNFPQKPTKVSELLARYNYTNLSIALDTSSTGIALWSPARAQRYFHYLTYRLYGPADIHVDDFRESAERIEEFLTANFAKVEEMNRLATVTLACVPADLPERLR